jgi:hypothetical protein
MAYSTTSPVKKIAEAGGNSVFFYISADVITDIDDSGYFDTDFANFKNGDVILTVSGVGGTQAIDVLTISSATAATTVTVAVLA